MKPGRWLIVGAALFVAGCAEPYGDLRGELKSLAQVQRGRVPPLGPAAPPPDPAPPLAIERDPFNAPAGKR